MARSKKHHGRYAFGLIVVGLAAAGWGAGPGGWFEGEETVATEGVPVRRGDLRISEVARGNLEAKDSNRIVNELEGQPTIIFLAEEGSTVEKGDLVCELDVSDTRDKRVSQEIAVRNAEAEFTKSKEQYDIQELENKSAIAASELELELAKLDLEKYILEDGEWTNEQAEALEAITLAAEELKQNEATLVFSASLQEKGFYSLTELEGDELAVQRSKIKFEKAKRDSKLSVDYGHRRKLAELEAAQETAVRDVLKVEKQAAARLVDFEAARDSAEAKLGLERGKLEKLTDQLGKALIYAPEGGMLVYSRSKRGRGMSSGGDVPEEGGTVHERQEIATIPRAGGMTADASLHETRLKKIEVGQRCLVSVEALPGQVFNGRLAFVAAVADSGSWMSNPNQRLYRTEITLDETSPEMRPGMSCNIEILIDDRKDVLYAPRPAVFLDGVNTVCFVAKDGEVTPRTVQVGPDNNRWVEIESGLEEGEIVLLSPPASWEPTEVEPALASATTPEANIESGGEPSTGAPAKTREGSGREGRGPDGARSSEGGESRRGEGGDGGERRAGGFGGGGGGDRGGFMERLKNMSPEEREEMLKSIPEDRRARFEAMMNEADSGGDGGDGE